jgi:CheY-like chemotaxis protein
MTDSAAHRAPLVAIVDDEQDIVTYLRLALEDHGYRVFTVTESSTALERLAAIEPDVVCLDLLMPKHTGVALYAEIIRHPDLAGCPVLIMSGLTPREDLPKLLEEAGNLPQPACFLEKPIRVKQLIEALSELQRTTEGASTCAP